jgi:thiol-disulfide isomerase/thioredoxin
MIPMKYMFFFLVFATIQWEPDFDTAKKEAAAQHKLILLNFSGSDWCAPCILMRRNYLDSEAFATMAKENLILVNADFPRKSKNALSADIVKRNGELAEQYNRRGNFPFTLLLDSNGKVLKTWNGKPDVSVGEWVKEVRLVCDANK